MSEVDYKEWMNKEGRFLVWNNYFQAIDLNREYKGNWKKGETAWEGLGVIKFKDGSKYEGFTKNKMLNGKGRMTHANGDIY